MLLCQETTISSMTVALHSDTSVQNPLRTNDGWAIAASDIFHGRFQRHLRQYNSTGKYFVSIYFKTHLQPLINKIIGQALYGAGAIFMLS
jgi:hypothetical protein